MKMTNEEMNALCRKHKSALTRAKKKGPQEVILAVNAAFDDFDHHEMAWPDNWHDWQRAKLDAWMEIQRSVRQF